MDKRLEVDTLIFDLDGTLLDTLTDLATAVNFALRSHGLPERSRAEIRLMLGNGVRRLMRDAAPVDLTNEQFEGIFSTFRDYYMEHCLDTTSPYEGIIPLLSALCEYGFRLGIVSNKLDSAVQELNTRFFLNISMLRLEKARRCGESLVRTQ